MALLAATHERIMHVVKEEFDAAALADDNARVIRCARMGSGIYAIED